MVVYWYASNIGAFLLHCGHCRRLGDFDTEQESINAMGLHSECDKVAPMGQSALT